MESSAEFFAVWTELSSEGIVGESLGIISAAADWLDAVLKLVGLVA